MSHPIPTPLRRTSSRVVLALAAAFALIFVSAAPAKAPAPIVKKGKAAGKATVVTAKGLTLYRLKPETTKKLLCVNLCTGIWVPVTVKTAKTKVVAGAGVSGKLTVFTRSDGKHLHQVALRGLPLYRFVGDSAPGTASGKGIQSFGGTWLIVAPK